MNKRKESEIGLTEWNKRPTSCIQEEIKEFVFDKIHSAIEKEKLKELARSIKDGSQHEEK
jgi:hypothetical protein